MRHMTGGRACANSEYDRPPIGRLNEWPDHESRHGTDVGRLPDAASLCEALQSEPLFHLSLHAKELFHSNLLAWLCETHPVAATNTFERWVLPRHGTEVVRVQREKGNLDLTVELPGLTSFVLENKVFSPPDEQQLDDYAAGPLGGLVDPTLLLLSLGRPAWEGGTHRSPTGQHWRYLSYLDLADALESARSHINGAFDADLVAHYCGFIRSLDQLATVVGHVGENDSIAAPEPIASLLRDIRLHDAIGKLRARVAIAAAKAHTAPQLPDHHIRWEALFSNGRPLVAAFLNRGDGDWLGWQYQNDQWRIVVITERHSGKTAIERSRRHRYVAERYASWFDFSRIPALVGRAVDAVPPTEARGEYNGYNPDFVYRYRKLTGLTRTELAQLSHHYLSEAAVWRERSGLYRGVDRSR